jgi:hypothetical protein
MYYRFTNSDSPISDWGHAMFTKDLDAVSEGAYGKNGYIYDGRDGVKIEDLRQIIIDTWNECKDNDDWSLTETNGWDMDYYKNLTAEEVYNTFNPINIVDTADAFDCELTGWFWFYIAEPYNVKAILTNDGAIVFDEALITKMEGEG